MKDLSIIVTAHNEGIIAYKTIRSVFECIECLEDGVDFEFIAHIDDGDALTRKCFEQFPSIKIIDSKFGDPGLSRNFAVSKSCGRYVSLVDADDLLSSNWLKEAFSMVSSTNEAILVHPEANLTFNSGDCSHVLWLQRNSSDNLLSDIYILAAFNRWASPVMGKREIFLDTPYPSTEKGFGHEDYWFNVETLAKGIKHFVVPNTIEFYRKKDNSVLSQNNESCALIKMTTLFDFRNIQFLHKVIDYNKEFRKKSVGKFFRYSNKLSRYISYKFKSFDSIPGFVIDEWRKINSIETGLFPTKGDLRCTRFYDSDSSPAAGKAFCDLVCNVERRPDYTFFVPWISAGGADKLLLNYISAIKEIHPDWKILVIATLPSSNKWRAKIPEGVDFMDFGNRVEYLNDFERDAVFSLIVSQLGCKRVHIINSDYMYKWVAKHRVFAKSNLKINVSAFSYVLTKHNGMFSYFDPDIVSIYDLIDKIFTDNKNVVKQSIIRNGFDESKFRVHYQPYIGEMLTHKRAMPTSKVHILWAGRIAYTKCPELLCEIAKQLPKSVFQIDVYGNIDGDEGYSKKMFDNIPSLSYRGTFDDFSEIKSEKYDLFLYTSNSDGLPNILLEVGAVGLPIIASDVGGVGELIRNKKTGILAPRDCLSGGYVKLIKDVCKDQDEIKEYSKNLQKLIERDFSWENFVKCVKRDLM